MNPLRISIIAAIICVASSAFADPIKIGSGIDKAITDMRAKGYDESGLAMGPSDESNDLKFWGIDDGVLIAVYSKNDKKIKSMSYWFADERGMRDGSASSRTLGKDGVWLRTMDVEGVIFRGGQLHLTNYSSGFRR